MKFMNHFTKGISNKIKKYAIDEVFKAARYIFTWREGKQQYGYCTYCKKEFTTNGLKHNETTECPQCNSRCTIKASGIGRKYLVNEAYFVYYEKSAINPDAIIARGIYAVRDLSGDFRKVKTIYTVVSWYLFEMGHSEMYSQHAYYFTGPYCSQRKVESYCFGKNKSVFSLYSKHPNILSCYSRKSIEEAVKDTPFRWSGWESHDYEDMIRFFDLYSKYPCIEYLTKLGFKNLVRYKMEGSRTYSTINWRGKNLFKVLKITKQELNEIKSEEIDVTFELLKLIQMSKKDGSKFSPSEAARVANDYQYYISDLEMMLEHGKLRKITSYLAKQRDKNSERYSWASSALYDWRDYIADCRKLGLDITNENILFPRNLHRAHQNTIKQIKLKEDEELNQKIKDRLKKLEKYRFRWSGLEIRPAESSKELINEGKALNHCVGTYADKYAKGETIILFVRKISAPNKPYYTVEVIDGRVTQTRGFKNCKATKKVSKFMELFEEERLSNKQKRKAS